MLSAPAIISECGQYRYWLARDIDMLRDGLCLFVMLNPSTADASEDDPTIRRCIGYAKAWGFGRLGVVNLFALRSTDPKALRQSPDPEGRENGRYLWGAVHDADRIICAWGNHGSLHQASQRFRYELRLRGPLIAERTFALRVSKTGEPGHPLYLPKTAEPFPYPEDTTHD